MKVYLAGDRQRRQPVFIMCVAPAATVQNMEIPQAWLEVDGKPKQINIEFNHGMAEVDSAMGQYLLENQLVRKTALYLPSDVETDPNIVLG